MMVHALADEFTSTCKSDFQNHNPIRCLRFTIYLLYNHIYLKINVHIKEVRSPQQTPTATEVKQTKWSG